jgi:hypothetical protein
MKNVLISSFVHGFKDSFRLAICLVVGVASIIGAFSNHTLGERRGDPKRNEQPSSPN